MSTNVPPMGCSEPPYGTFFAGLGLCAFGVAVLGVTVSILMWLSGFRHGSDLKALRTPRRPLFVVAAANAAWLAYGLAQGISTVRLQVRGATEFVDHVEFAPAGGLILALVTLIPMNIVLAAYFRRANLPASLWARPRGAKDQLLSLIAIALLLGSVVHIFYSIYIGDLYSIPALTTLASVLLVARGAACSVQQLAPSERSK
jgi:hypothetical protein